MYYLCHMHITGFHTTSICDDVTSLVTVTVRHMTRGGGGTNMIAYCNRSNESENEIITKIISVLVTKECCLPFAIIF